MKKITAETTIGDILDNYSEKTEILASHMKAVCLGCPSRYHETLEEAAAHHEIDLEKLLEELNKKEEE